MDILDMAMDILDIMASVRLRPRLRLLLIPTFCMEDTAMPDTILDMLDTHMLDMPDMPTTDKLQSTRLDPATNNRQNIHQCLLPQ